MSDVKELVRTHDTTKTPKMHNVYLINDDYTTFGHVLYVLTTIFGKGEQEAEKIVFQIHYNGKALVAYAGIDAPPYQSGQYTYKCNVVGDFTWFQGYEEIFCENVKVYECYFHGGIVK